MHFHYDSSMLTACQQKLLKRIAGVRILMNVKKSLQVRELLPKHELLWVNISDVYILKIYSKKMFPGECKT